MPPSSDALHQHLLRVAYQVLPLKVFSLVDYSNTESDESVTNKPMSSPCHEVFPKLRTNSILMQTEPDFGRPQYDSNESVVDKTSDEDSVTDHSSMHSVCELVRKLRRTKSILMTLCAIKTDHVKSSDPAVMSEKQMEEASCSQDTPQQMTLCAIKTDHVKSSDPAVVSEKCMEEASCSQDTPQQVKLNRKEHLGRRQRLEQ
ncbi:uncharacterized protein LOC116058001 isoform X3 [Xyrichtys novacula]|uniref:Uncharacterized protein LOC116058001 isoform X3 n=1 Tax=Xyrichtys novacula TaxID=13765 RepID=A0AAV1FZN2_XYRNO|nr:uncharacterized protein LOC116058001 isoform X3 [Xyrichtys novacula]